MSPIAERLQQFLDVKGLGVVDFAKKIGIPNAESVYRIFRENDARPTGAMLEKISKKFVDLDMNWLIGGLGSMLISEKKAARSVEIVQNVSEPAPKYAAIRAPKIITVNQQGVDNIVYVPVKARAGYLLGFGDEEYIEKLESFQLPGLKNGSYRTFEVDGDSMEPRLKNHDWVVGRYIENPEDIRDNRVHIVVTNEGILIKRVLNRIAERGKIYLKSDTITNRASHPTIELDPADIREMWYAVGSFSTDFSEPGEMYHRLNDVELDLMRIKKMLNIEDKKNKLSHRPTDLL